MIDDDELVDPVPGRRPLVDHDHGAPGAGQLEGDRRPDDTGTDHDGICRITHEPTLVLHPIPGTNVPSCSSLCPAGRRAGFFVTPFCDDTNMSSFGLPDAADVAAMSPAEREAFARVLDRERRQAEAKVAMFVHTVAQIGGHLEDKHRTPAAWGRAACNWSDGEAGRFVKAGKTLALFDSARSLAEAGRVGCCPVACVVIGRRQPAGAGPSRGRRGEVGA
jgi:hypothetical protein